MTDGELIAIAKLSGITCHASGFFVIRNTLWVDSGLVHVKATREFLCERLRAHRDVASKLCV